MVTARHSLAMDQPSIHSFTFPSPDLLPPSSLRFPSSCNHQQPSSAIIITTNNNRHQSRAISLNQGNSHHQLCVCFPHLPTTYTHSCRRLPLRDSQSYDHLIKPTQSHPNPSTCRNHSPKSILPFKAFLHRHQRRPSIGARAPVPME